MRRRARALAAVAVGVAVFAIAGCGRDDFENESRPAVAAQLSVKLGEDAVVVSPAELGAGLATFTILNLADTTGSLEISGPTTGTSAEIPPGATGSLRMELETGEYEASAGGVDAESFAFEVGPARESSRDEVLLP
ncbi:MAG: hypothetical protein ACXWYV_02715 [Solirubrobacterales bacterium]